MLVDELVFFDDLTASLYNGFGFLSPGISQRDRVAEFRGYDMGHPYGIFLDTAIFMCLFICRNKTVVLSGICFIVSIFSFLT